MQMLKRKLSERPRKERRVIAGMERAERASGAWSPWRKLDKSEIEDVLATAAANGQSVQGTWGEPHTIFENGWLVVNVRTAHPPSLKFPVDHAFFRTTTFAELNWKEKQRVKDELFGADRTAIEIFPRQADLVDAINMYHLWVFPAGFKFPFGLSDGQS